MAQAAGVAALEHADYVSECVRHLHEHKASLVREIAALGLEPVPSKTHFFLIRVGDAAAYRRRLLARRIQVRDCASFGLPAYVRIATLRPTENARLVEALRGIAA
jgi:histidinol-phosphate/aromatic aminotransferase/cobyric acid decarboxylase-like protein